MAGIILFVSLVITFKCLSAERNENLPSDKGSFDTSPVKLMANNNCTEPKPVVSDSKLKWRVNVYNQSVFLPGEKAEFVCDEGFRQVGWLPTLTCQKDGTWSPRKSDIEDFKASENDLGYCITNNCSASGTFNCTSGNEDVPICKRCDCVADCVDGSDEMACGPILINVTGLATGEINSPKDRIHYTGSLNCSRILWTDDAGFYIKLLFTNFIIPGDCADNFIFIENATFSDAVSSLMCCKETKNLFCAFGNQTGPPPLSHTDKNFMIVNFASQESNSSSFSAKWYNVNGFYPCGAIPKDDSGYAERIKFERSSSSNIKGDSTDSTYIAAAVIFSIVAFAVLAIVACKLGRHFLGPPCSLEYCCAWIAAKKSQRSPRLSPRREPSPEARPITADIQEAHSRGGPRRTVPVDARAPSTLRTRYGSAENA